MQARPSKKSLAAIIGAVAAAGSLLLVPRWEGTELTTYKDIAGILTYCTGATENAMWGKTYTVEECKEQLDYDLARHAEGMMKCVKAPLTDGQKIAFTSLTYNIGVGNFCASTVARKANQGDLIGSCAALPAWSCVSVGEGKGDTTGICKSKKTSMKYVRGLANRRAAEKSICLGGAQ